MAANPEILDKPSVKFTFNDTEVEAFPGETILECAKRHDIAIPHLCYKPGYRADGNCRACMVEIEGERVLAPSCCRTPKEGMQVNSASKRAVRSQKMILELLRSDMPGQGESPHSTASELDHWARELGVKKSRFPQREQPAPDVSNPAISVNLDACIQCTRCVRACREEQANDVIGYALRGKHAKIVFDLDDAMGDSTCVSCGECVQACPTGALMPASETAKEISDRQVESVCPYCGVGCQLTFHIKGNRILSVKGRDGPANHSRLCVKGRYGFDYIYHPDRLTRPLIRKLGMAKTGRLLSPDEMSEYFRIATWEEALGRVRISQGQ